MPQTHFVLRIQGHNFMAIMVRTMCVLLGGLISWIYCTNVLTLYRIFPCANYALFQFLGFLSSGDTGQHYVREIHGGPRALDHVL